ncbi:MAG: phytoene/squalene synthase family protein [Methanospirillum sp.]|nr:phytoene/squalene synthase family protein [Methanospirillum sp.]
MTVIDQTIYEIFRRGSRTYFYSSLFFPPSVKADVFTLYSFVRTADDLVDSVPQRETEFHAFVRDYRAVLGATSSGDPVIDGFVDLQRRCGFEQAWVDAFLRSMEMDLSVREYRTMNDLRGYLHGSAEVVGLMMSRLMGLDDASHPAACRLGRAMQYINFVRDIAEDAGMGRIYMPREELDRFGLDSLDEGFLRRHPSAFRAFIHAQCDRYRSWHSAGERGYRFIPWRMRLPIMTASDMYGWTARQIERDPFVIFNRKVRPSVPRIVSHLAANTVRPTE